MVKKNKAKQIFIIKPQNKEVLIDIDESLEIECCNDNMIKIKNKNIFDDKDTITDLINRAIRDCHCDNLNTEKLTKNIIYYLYGDEE